MLDLNEAFDSINHVVLLEKLKRTVVIIYSALYWFRSFFVEVKMTHGVSHGITLGPLLFNVYISDLPSVSTIINIASYASYLAFSNKLSLEASTV